MKRWMISKKSANISMTSSSNSSKKKINIKKSANLTDTRLIIAASPSEDGAESFGLVDSPLAAISLLINFLTLKGIIKLGCPIPIRVGQAGYRFNSEVEPFRSKKYII